MIVSAWRVEQRDERSDGLEFALFMVRFLLGSIVALFVLPVAVWAMLASIPFGGGDKAGDRLMRLIEVLYGL